MSLQIIIEYHPEQLASGWQSSWNLNCREKVHKKKEKFLFSFECKELETKKNNKDFNGKKKWKKNRNNEQEEEKSSVYKQKIKRWKSDFLLLYAKRTLLSYWITHT